MGGETDKGKRIFPTKRAELLSKIYFNILQNTLTINTELKQNPNTEHKTKTPFSTPEKIALLQITGLEQTIDTLTGDVTEQKYRLLSAIFGVSYETVKKAYLNHSVKGVHVKRARDFYDKNFSE